MKLEQAFVTALTESKNEYGVEDLNLLVGNYIGNHKKLKNLTSIKFQKIDEFLN